MFARNYGTSRDDVTVQGFANNISFSFHRSANHLHSIFRTYYFREVVLHPIMA